ncbi:MAG: hypothetical protein R2865_13105 [Deinococcales bacterium]
MSEEKHVAIFDLGSNTARLIVMAYQPHKSYRQIDELRFGVRIAGAMGEEKIIRADAFERGLNAFLSISSYCKAAGIDRVKAVATSAIRDARNGDSFIASVKERTGIEITILSGEREAYYGSLAAINSLALENAFVFDLGGGSAQISRVKDKSYQEGFSYPIGAVRMSETFLSEQPPKKKAIRNLIGYVRELIAAQQPEGFGQAKMLVGMGGSMRNLAKIHSKRHNYPIDLRHSYRLSKEDLHNLANELLSKDIKSRS